MSMRVLPGYGIYGTVVKFNSQFDNGTGFQCRGCRWAEKTKEESLFSRQVVLESEREEAEGLIAR